MAHSTDVVDVAGVILRHADQESKEMTKKKLHKLAYYTQAWALAALRRPAFESEIEAWRDGPLVPRLRDETRWTPCSAVLRDAVDRDVQIDDELDFIVQMVVDQYGDMTEKEIIDQTHSEEPWITARGDTPDHSPSNERIPKSSLSDFFVNGQTLGGFTADEINMLGFDVLAGNYTDDFDLKDYLDETESSYDPALDESANLFSFR